MSTKSYAFDPNEQVARWEHERGKTWRRLMVSHEEAGFCYRVEEARRDEPPANILEAGTRKPTHDAAVQEALESSEYADEIRHALLQSRTFSAAACRHVK